MLGSDDREEELEADEAVWERLRADAGGKPGQEHSVRDASGPESYGEEPTGAFDRGDPAIASAFEQDDDFEEPSAMAHAGSYELAEADLEEDDLEEDDLEEEDEEDDFEEHAQFDAADDELAEEYDAGADGSHVDEEEDEEDEEALWAQARASLELANRQDEAARQEAAQRAAYAAYERQSHPIHEQLPQQHGYQQGYDAGAFGAGQHYADGAAHEGYEGPDAYQRPSHVTPYGYTEDAFGSRHSDVGRISSHPQAQQGEQAGFANANYAQAASTGFPPAQAPGAFNQQAWAENFDVPDGSSKPRGRGASRVLKGLLGAAVVAAAAGAGAYQFVLLPQQERARAAELAALEAQQQKVIEQERIAKESAARAEAEQRAAAEAALKRAEEAAAAAGGVAADVTTAVPEAGKPKSRTKASDEGESRAERKARERAERKERREAAKSARAERRERKAKPAADDAETESAPEKRAKKAAAKADSQAAAEAANDDPLFGL